MSGRPSSGRRGSSPDLAGRVDEIQRLPGPVAGNTTKIDREADVFRDGPDVLPDHAVGALGGAFEALAAAA